MSHEQMASRRSSSASCSVGKLISSDTRCRASQTGMPTMRSHQLSIFALTTSPMIAFRAASSVSDGVDWYTASRNCRTLATFSLSVSRSMSSTDDMIRSTVGSVSVSGPFSTGVSEEGGESAVGRSDLARNAIDLRDSGETRRAWRLTGD